MKKKLKKKSEKNEKKQEKKRIENEIKIRNDKHPLRHALLGVTLWGNTTTEKACFQC